MDKKKIVIAGGNGFLGKILAKFFDEKGYEIVILSRKTFDIKNVKVVIWDGKSIGNWKDELESAYAIINLAGRTVNCRYNSKNVKQMYDSRIFTTRILGDAVRQLDNPPRVWINSSTATIYEHTYGKPHTETSHKICSNADAKDEISVDLAQKWEEEFNKINCEKIRKIIIRTAIVFGNESGSAYDVLRKLTKFGLGGKMGHGKQFVSWIHSLDFCRSIEWLLNNEKSQGIYNIASLNPVTNSKMMEILRRIHNIPIGLPATKFMLEIGAFFLRTETELIIKSRNVISERLSSEGFEFLFNDFEEAILNLENEKTI